MSYVLGYFAQYDLVKYVTTKYSVASAHFEKNRRAGKSVSLFKEIVFGGQFYEICILEATEERLSNGNRWKRRFLAREFASLEYSENIFGRLGYSVGGKRWTLVSRVRFYEDLLKSAGKAYYRRGEKKKRRQKERRSQLDQAEPCAGRSGA